MGSPVECRKPCHGKHPSGTPLKYAFDDERPSNESVLCPDEREAVLRFGSPGPARIYLNGQKLEIAQDKTEGLNDWILRELQQTAPFYLHKGENHLLIDTRPPQEGRPFWVFGAGLTAPGQSEPMTGLTFA